MTQLKWQNLPLNTLSSHIPVQTLHAWGHRLVLPWFDFRPFLISLYLRECVSFLGRDSRQPRRAPAASKSQVSDDDRPRPRATPRAAPACMLMSPAASPAAGQLHAIRLLSYVVSLKKKCEPFILITMPRTTLSDLLAADVQDYFRREGVNESTKSNERQKPIDRQSSRRRRRPAVHDDDPGVSVAASSNAEGVSYNSSNHGRRLSNGSDSKHSFMTAQDAEFIKRYAQEKERDRALRMNIRDRSVNEAAPKELVDKDCINLKPSEPGSPRKRSNTSDSNQANKGSSLRPYQTLAASPRPPSVTGSHRPQLATIDNDDWEEDDRLEQKELRRKERHMRKMSNASRMSNSSMGGHWRMHSSNGSVGNGSFIRQMIQQSDSPTRSYVRKESEDTFIRQYDSLHSSYGGEEYNHNGHHTRPLSYLSASSDSEQKSEVNTSSHGPSPLSSGTFKTLPSDRYSVRSKDESEVSALWGGSILESSSPGSDKPQQYRTSIGYRQESSEYSDEDYTSTSDESSYDESDSSGYKKVQFSEADRLLPRHNSYSSIPRQHNKRPKVSPLRLDAALKVIWDKLWHGIVLMELYISNMPSLVGSLALAWSSLGVDWFKVRILFYYHASTDST